MNKILLIGCGHMGSALLKAWSFREKNYFTVVDPTEYKKINKISNKKVEAYQSLSLVTKINSFNIIVFAIKPQIASFVLKEFNKYKFKKNVVFVSIIAGKKLNFYNRFLPLNNQFIRVMPNMPAMINQGISCLIANQKVSKLNKKKIELLFLKVGKIIWLKNEEQINKVTAVSGSGPGFVFLFIDAFEKASLKLGLGKKTTKQLVNQTVLGSIFLLLHSKKNPAELIKNIAVKGGTTEAGLNELIKKDSLHAKFEKAIKSAFLKANKLGKTNR